MPTNILKPDVLALAPELSTLADGAWVEILSYVNAMDDECFDAPSFRMARIFLAAHLGTTSRRGVTGAVGPLVREAAGGLQRSYGLVSTTAGSSELSSTMYGTQYLAILRASDAHGPFLV